MLSTPWWGPTLLRRSAYFGVRRIEVTGARYLAPDAVAAALGLGPEANVFEDLGRLERRVRAVAGVESATVSRRLPGTLRVRIREVEPVALVEGPEGLVPVASEGQPLPYDVTLVPVDVPVVPRADRGLVAALAQIQRTDPGLYAEVSAAATRGGGVELTLGAGRIRLELPVDPEVVRAVSAVRRDLTSRSAPWAELDGRFKGWIVVRRGTV